MAKMARDFKDIFGNGMSWGTKWQGVEVARVQSAKLRIALPEHQEPGPRATSSQYKLM